MQTMSYFDCYYYHSNLNYSPLLEITLHAFTCVDMKKTSYSPYDRKMGYLKPINSSNSFLIGSKLV